MTSYWVATLQHSVKFNLELIAFFSSRYPIKIQKKFFRPDIQLKYRRNDKKSYPIKKSTSRSTVGQEKIGSRINISSQILQSIEVAFTQCTRDQPSILDDLSQCKNSTLTTPANSHVVKQM